MEACAGNSCGAHHYGDKPSPSLFGMVFVEQVPLCLQLAVINHRLMALAGKHEA